MNMFVARFRDIAKGVLTGFDRIVFKESILPLMHAKGAMSFCCAHGIRNKDIKVWAMKQTGQVVLDSPHFEVGGPVDHVQYPGTIRGATTHARKTPFDTEPKRFSQFPSGGVICEHIPVNAPVFAGKSGEQRRGQRTRDIRTVRHDWTQK
jgi:hypothetical protein